MKLAIECLIVCLIYGVVLTALVLRNREAWLYEYAPEVQKRYLQKNPNHTAKKRTKQTASVIVAKVLFCVGCCGILSALVYYAGARGFGMGMLYSYVIWAVVNLFDAIILDIGVFAHWRKIRLPGTEDMDKEYTSNQWKDIKGGLIGFLIGMPVSVLSGAFILLFS